MTELNASRAVQHVNVFSGPHLIGTWNPAAGKVYYAYSDWLPPHGRRPVHGGPELGTKRYEADGSGTYVNSWTSLPFGDNETALGTGTDATEHHFTGKEHDAESGLDYFKARYYQSQTGRWLLPDWSETPVPVPYATFTNPQSLNLYTYVGNNPVNAVDADGHAFQNGQDGSSRTGEGVTQPQACGTQNADAVTSNNSVCVVVQDGTTTPTASPSQAAANNQVAPPQDLSADSKEQKAERAEQALEGTANLLDASLRAKALGGAVAALSEAPPAAAVVAVYGVVSIFGQTITGTAQITEAFTGNNSGVAHKAEQVGNILSGPAAGLITAAKTRNLNKAATAGNVESLYTAGTGLVDKSIPFLQRAVEFGMSLLGVH